VARYTAQRHEFQEASSKGDEALKPDMEAAARRWQVAAT
jgi:hypothetical protein